MIDRVTDTILDLAMLAAAAALAIPTINYVLHLATEAPGAAMLALGLLAAALWAMERGR